MDTKPLAVPPKMGRQMLQVGQTKLYELLANNELDSFNVGRARRITTASIEAYVARQLANNALAA